VDSDTGEIAPDYVAVVCKGIPDRFNDSWSHFDRSQQLRALSRFVEWDGFDYAEIAIVSRKVIDGSPKEEWFAGTDKLVDDWLRSCSGEVVSGSDGLMTRNEQTKLFREWDEDYAARREENQQEQEGEPSSVPRETWPSEIAKTNRLKHREQVPGKSNSREHGHDGVSAG
jgi:hypothetical protein